jgi:uncharacterized OB-fold protein
LPRSILSASLVRPVWQVGDLRVEGPDEDAFTLGLAALGRLGHQIQPSGVRALGRLHLVGSFPPEVEWSYAEALGISQLEVRRHSANAPGLWGALAAATHDDESTGREAVISAETAAVSATAIGGLTVRHGAGAAAFLLGDEPGLAVLRHGFRGHAPGRGPAMRGVVTGWLDALGLSAGGGAGEVVFATDEDPPKWQAAWEETAPGVSVTVLNSSLDPAGQALALFPALLLWEVARRLRTTEIGIVGQADRGRTGFAGFRLDGPVRWLGSWSAPEPGLVATGERFLERGISLQAVSQGAYVPYPRYLENLASRWRLVGERCAHCHAVTFPASGRCRGCGRTDGLRAEPLPRNALKVEAVTTIAPGAQPTEFDGFVETVGGYDVAVVTLGPHTRATVQITDSPPGRLRVGDRVGLLLRRLYPMEGEWRYGLKGIPENVARPEGVPHSLNSPRRHPRRGASSGAPRAHRSTPRRPAGPTAKHRPRRR